MLARQDCGSGKQVLPDKTNCADGLLAGKEGLKDNIDCSWLSQNPGGGS